MLWVPAVEQFAERMAEAHEGLEKGTLNDAKARKASLKAEIPQSSTSGRLEPKGLGGLVVGGLRRMSLMGASPKRYCLTQITPNQTELFRDAQSWPYLKELPPRLHPQPLTPGCFD